MNILHINTEKTWRGGEQQTLYLLQGLRNRKITSHLICQPGSPMARAAATIGTVVFPLSMHGEIDFTAAYRIRKLIRRYQYEIIHCHTSHAHTLAFLASWGTNVRRLVTRRVDFSIFRHSFLHLSGIKYRRMADFYIAISRKIKEVLVSDGIAAERIFVVYSGIDPDRFVGASSEHLISEFAIKDDEKIVINVAHLAGHKGQKYLVRAIPAVLERFPRTRFFVVGGGALREELKAMAFSIGLTDELVFTGFREDVGAFYHLADLFVMSSVEEGLGTAVLDALALGKAVVATDCGGIPEMITDGENGLLVPAKNPSALAAGIIEMLADLDRAGRLAARGPELVKARFSIEAMVAGNVNVYGRILSPHGSQPMAKA
ncbi:MAG: glycosyltransferase family 4 protein [Desulfobacterales bacterium]|nr:MAG: glycosyltransferase family 4 protein [Desulfobacterales bacterium]